MLGSNSLSDISDNAQRIPCSGVYVHPDYGVLQNSSFDSDIALMKMERPYEINDYVRTVCVPQKAQEEDGFGTSKPVTITGWGTTYEGGELLEVANSKLTVIKWVLHHLPKISMFCALSQNEQQPFEKKNYPFYKKKRKKMFKEVKNGIEILVGQVSFKLQIKTVKMLFLDQ